MKSTGLLRTMVILTSAITGAFLLWVVQLIWFTAAEFDRNPSRTGVKSQIMHRKSESMQDILDGMVAGNLGHVHLAAKRMERCGEMIEWYLASEDYDKFKANFFQAVDDLTTSAAHKDINNAMEATLRLEQSCMECHILLNAIRIE